MSRLEHVAIIGAGAAGLTAATLLARDGIVVDLFERRPAPEGGSGIALQANALRVLEQVGALPAVLAGGYGFDSTAIRLPDAMATVVAELTEGRFVASAPATVGIARASLIGILEQQAVEGGATIRRGETVRDVEQDDVGVRLVTGSSDRSRRYDLLIAADGLSSPTRGRIGVTARPEPQPLGLWRVFVSRPTDLTRMEIINGGVAKLAGLCPAGPDTAYGWLTEDAQDRRATPKAEQLALFVSLARHYGGNWPDVVSAIDADTPITYTRYTRLLVDPPWHRNRVVLTGDAVHSCPPTMAQGAALSLEDAAVLSELLLASRTVDDATLQGFAERRFPRVRAVVEGSMAIMDQQLGGPHVDVPRLIGRTNQMLASAP